MIGVGHGEERVELRAHPVGVCMPSRLSIEFRQAHAKFQPGGDVPPILCRHGLCPPVGGSLEAADGAVEIADAAT
jgi:hypothetical protein